VGPNTGLKVCDPSPNSGVFVFPIRIAPASRMRRTMSASSVGMWVARSGEPFVLRRPRTGARSLIACGMPCSQPRDCPCARRVSWAAASASSVSYGRNETIALKRGLKASTRARHACITSTQDTLRACRRAESSSAEVSRRSASGMVQILLKIRSHTLWPSCSPRRSNLVSGRHTGRG